MPLSSLCMQNMGQGLDPADEASRHLMEPLQPLHSPNSTPKTACHADIWQTELPALCVSLQPVIKQLGWFSNMSVIKYLFY